MTRFMLLPTIALVLSACSGAGDDIADNSGPVATEPTPEIDHSMATDLIRTRGAGTVMATDPETYFITLDHEAIPAIRMDAMRMPFDVAEDIDLTPYAEGDAVIFDLEASEDTGLLITKLCRPSTDGNDCLDD